MATDRTIYRHHLELLRTKRQLRIAKTALALTQQCLDYCGGGDSWERECNGPAMLFADAACEKLGLDTSSIDGSHDAMPALWRDVLGVEPPKGR